MNTDVPTLAPADVGWLATAAATAAADAPAGLALAARYGVELPLPGDGETLLRWHMLATVGAADLTAARILEAHTDALAILAEAGRSAEAGSWGVFAAEGRGVRLDATVGPRGWQVSGTKPWCSLGGRLSHALVTAHVEGGRRLFAVDLKDPSVRADPPSGWVARGLSEIPSGPVHFDGTRATPVGDTGWYLRRPGFSWGGIGVAACWFGAAVALERTLQAAAARSDDVLLRLHLGTADVAVWGAMVALRAAAAEVDAGGGGELLALRVRSIVATAAELVIERVGHALGPAPLAFDAEHARRVADLAIYIRQHHAERDLVATADHLVAAES